MFSADIHFYCSVVGTACNFGASRKNLLNKLQNSTSLSINEANKFLDTLIDNGLIVENNKLFFVKS